MAVLKPKIQADIFKLLNQMANETGDPVSARQKMANGLSTIIVSAILSADVTVLPGIPVAVAGTAVAQTGATVGPGTGKLI